MFNVKISSICLERKRANVVNSRNFHGSFKKEMVCYSSNFANKLQMMVEIGKEYRFTLNIDMAWPFTQRKTELLRKMANSQSDCLTASCIPE